MGLTEVDHAVAGVVCGNVAVHCHYPEKPRGQGTADTGFAGRDSQNTLALPVWAKKFQPLLEHLSGNGASGPWGLGDVQLTKALSCSSQWTGKAPPKEDVVHVFLGDPHLPVITNPELTYLWLDQCPPQPPTTLVADKVPRYGQKHARNPAQPGRVVPGVRGLAGRPGSRGALPGPGRAEML